MAILLFYLFRIQESGFRIHWFFLFSSGYISITWLVSFKFIAGNGHQLKISHGTFWFLHCSWTTTTSWPLVARGRTQNETTVNGTILQKSFHSAVWIHFYKNVLFRIEFLQKYLKNQPALHNVHLIRVQVLLNNAGRETLDSILAKNNSWILKI